MLSMDDDLNINASEIQNSFIYYKEHNYKNRIFGMSPRFYKNHSYIDRKKNYNLVLTNYAFLNIRMLELFNLYETLIDFVIKIKNGEDLLMNYVVSHLYKLSPIAINIKSYHDHTHGISMRPKHYINRAICCEHFEKYFGYDVVGNYTTASMDERNW